MKKRVISIFLCVAMTASMLIGCGSSSDKKEDKSETSTESKGNDLETDTVRLALAGSAHIFNATQMDDIDIVSYCSDVTPNYSCCRVEANTKWVNENPNTVKALLRAWLRAQEWYEGHKDESKAIVAKTLETDEDYVAAYMDNEHYRLNLDPFKSSIERAWGYMLKLNLFDEGAEDINIDDHINTELYKAALDECIDKYHDENPDFYDTMLETYNEYDK